MTSKFRLGTRGSALARWQTAHVIGLLQTAWPDLSLETVIMTTQGDRAPNESLLASEGKGLFTQDLEVALRGGQLDGAVHSLKDLPTLLPPDLIIGMIPKRGTVADVLISRTGKSLEELPKGAVIGTSSRRRGAQLRRLRPDLVLQEIRGNVDTRIKKALDPNGPYDAIILAYAGLERLQRLDVVTQTLSLEQMLPAPGQAALALQTRVGDSFLAYLAPITDQPTAATVTAERAFLNSVGAGCSLPVAAYGHWEDNLLHLTGRILSVDGTQQIEVTLAQSVYDELGMVSLSLAAQLGQQAGQEAKQHGADTLLASL